MPMIFRLYPHSIPIKPLWYPLFLHMPLAIPYIPMISFIIPIVIPMLSPWFLQLWEGLKAHVPPRKRTQACSDTYLCRNRHPQAATSWGWVIWRETQARYPFSHSWFMDGCFPNMAIIGFDPYIYMCIYELSIYVSIHPSIHPIISIISIFLSFHLSIFLSLSFSLCLSLSLYLSLCLNLSISLSLPVCIYVFLFLSTSISISIYPHIYIYISTHTSMYTYLTCIYICLCLYLFLYFFYLYLYLPISVSNSLSLYYIYRESHKSSYKHMQSYSDKQLYIYTIMFFSRMWSNIYSHSLSM